MSEVRPEKKYCVSFVAVGTELTSGELINSNAGWVSSRVEELGFEVQSHITVPDDADLIERALSQAAEVADLVFVSGGLGPTKDDFTRKIIARWAGKELVKDQNCVVRLRENFEIRGRTFHSFQEQQCEFPKGARVIRNEVGTADSFYIMNGETHVWTLPGPPREIESVWPEITEQLKSLAPQKFRLELKSWLCLGEGESVISAKTEKVVQGLPFSTGYRAHSPYVEVKVWGKNEDFKAHSQLEKLGQELGDLVVSTNKKTHSAQFFEELFMYGQSAKIIDHVSAGLWPSEILKAYKKEWNRYRVAIEMAPIKEIEEAVEELKYDCQKSLVFSIQYLPERKGVRAFSGRDGGWLYEDFVFDQSHNIGQRFNALLAIEKSCAFWLKSLTSS